MVSKRRDRGRGMQYLLRTASLTGIIENCTDSFVQLIHTR